MALQITGKVYYVGQTVNIPSKKGGQPFTKREIILDTTRFDPYTGERSEYENYPMFEFNGDKCKELDGLQRGQVVTITFDLQGTFFKGEDGKDKNFTRVRAYKVELRQQQMQQAPPPQQPQPQQPQYQQAPPQQQYQPNDYPPPPQQNNLPW